MRPTGVILTALFGILALSATVWIGRYQAQPPAIIAQMQPEKPVGPEIAAKGPYPKAVCEPTEHDFGVLPMGAEGQHVFTIRNEGEADLELMARKEDTTCSCTFGELSKDGKVPPGETVDVTLNWKVKLPNHEFRHRATIRTNDPDHKTIDLIIKGKVEDLLQMRPSEAWEFGEVTSSEPAVMKGVIFSKSLEKFEVKDIAVSGDGRLTVQATPMSPEELKEAEAKSGYVLAATVSNKIPLGPFSETVTLTTDQETVSKLMFKVNAIRPGPLELVGPGFQSGVGALFMSEFPAKEGKTSVISIFVRDFDQPLELVDAVQTFNSVKIEMTKDPKLTGKAQRYLLKITVPPGEPQDRQRKNSEKVTLKFNHPDAPELRIYIDYLAV